MHRFKFSIIVIHIAGWLLFMAFPLLFLNRGEQSNNFAILTTPFYWVFCITFIALFYINSNILIPKFFIKKKYIDYAIIAFFLLSVVYVIKPYDKLLIATDITNNSNHKAFGNFPRQGPGPVIMEHRPPGPPQGMPQNGPPGQMPPPPANGQPVPGNGFFPHHFGWHFDITSIFLYLMIMGISTAIKTVQQWQLTEQRATQAEADRASAELSFLKAQINPHFLFNTLNNIYTLAIIKDDNAADSIMKLSNIMRYVTDDLETDYVPLQNEIDCISDYIELQKLRLNENSPINYKVTGNAADKKIAPLILMTFVENVFKYGISKHETTIIEINIAIGEHDLVFFCQNKIFNKGNISGRTGIGLNNTKQRLEHLYPQKHLLNINDNDGFYTVMLTVQV